MTHSEFLIWLRERRACPHAIEWVAEHGHTPESAWSACEAGHWMLWAAAKAGVSHATLAPVAYRAASRAMGYAADALDRAGLYDEAARLRALPQIVCPETARAAADTAEAGRRPSKYTGYIEAMIQIVEREGDQ